jgi:hypothetical protein
MVIREKTRAAQVSGCPVRGDDDACVAAGRAEPAAAAVAGAPDVAALPEVESHPEQARASERTPPSRVPATWCLTMPPDFLRGTLPIPNVITQRSGQRRIAEPRPLSYAGLPRQ